MRVRLSLLVVAALALSGLAGVTAASASTPVPSPTNLTADFGSDPATPTLRWQPVAGATAYHVQIATDSGYATVVYDKQTVGHQLVPDQRLPVGTLYWRVSAAVGSATGPFATQSFTESWNTAPQLLSPTNYDPNDTSTALDYPDDPAVFSWTALNGAKSYTLQIDPGGNFTNPTSYTTPNTSYTLLDPQTVNQVYYWRVQATAGSGVVSQWSAVHQYLFQWPSVPGQPTPDQPDPAPMTPANGSTVTNVVFSWSAVSGARNYELQVSPNGDWTNNKTIDATLSGTSYTPGEPLQNGSYFWRVRSVDAAGHFGTWSDPLTFTRQWIDKPVLQAPAYDSSTPGVVPHVGSDFELRWSAVDHAALYEMQFAVDQNFSQTVSCYTNHTEWTPYTQMPVNGHLAPEPGGCFSPGNVHVPIWVSGTTYYWRVRGIDNPTGSTDSLVTPTKIVGLWSAPGEFIRDPTTPTPTGPADNAAVSVPTLSWNAVPGAEKYQVTLKNKNGSPVSGFPATTYGTSITPGTALTDTLSPYSWTVQAVDGAGLASVGSPVRHFSMSGTAPSTTEAALTPDSPADGSAWHYVPTLSWAPMDGAATYEVHLALNGFEIAPLVTKDPYPAYTPTSVPATAGTYTWWVEAFDSAGASLGVGDEQSSYQLLPLQSLASSDYLTPARCDIHTTCNAINDTPTFSWNPVPNAALYVVTIANDPNFTNVVRTYKTAYTTLTPEESLLDSQAGQAYYWFVRPCYDAAMTNCGPGPDDSSANSNASAFRKRSAPVQLTSPASMPSTSTTGVPDQITFTWQDYLESENGTGASQEAQRYHIQVSTAADFATVLDDKYVDATSYTPTTTTYPEGPLYWRVQAMDNSNNALTWSDNDGSTTYGWLVIKKSAPPTQTYPAAHATETGVPYLAWKPQDYAASYNVQVYRNADLNASPSNLVAHATTKFSAWAPTTGLPQGDYVWRVQRVDASGKFGPWSAMRAFHLEQQAPTLTSPAPNALINSSDLVFAWTAVPGASQYKWELSPTAGFNTLTASQTTTTNSWSPTAAIPDGSYYWRVQVLDGSSPANVLASSGTRTLAKDGTAPTVRTVGPTSALPITGALTATFSEPVTNVNANTFRVAVAGTSGAVAGTVGLATVDGVPTATWQPTRPLVPGETYTATLTSGITDDPAGNALVSRSWTVRTDTNVDNTSPAVVERWDRDAASGALGGTYDASNAKGSSATYHFTGTAVSVLGTRMKSGGNSAVYLDGVKQKSTASSYSARTQFRKVIWSASHLAAAPHTVQVVVLGSHPKGATGNWVYLDGFQVGTSQVDQSNAAVQEQFARVRSTSASGGSYDTVTHTTGGDTNGRPSYSVTFSGTGVAVYAVRSTSAGKAAVYLDGRLKSTVDLRSTSTTVAALASFSGLPSKVHTLRVDVLGTKTGSGSSVGIDYLRIS